MGGIYGEDFRVVPVRPGHYELLLSADMMELLVWSGGVHPSQADRLYQTLVDRSGLCGRKSRWRPYPAKLYQGRVGAVINHIHRGLDSRR